MRSWLSRSLALAALVLPAAARAGGPAYYPAYYYPGYAPTYYPAYYYPEYSHPYYPAYYYPTYSRGAVNLSAPPPVHAHGGAAVCPSAGGFEPDSAGNLPSALFPPVEP